MVSDSILTGLPGEPLIRKGLDDQAAGQPTLEACLVAIARPRLERAGLVPPGGPSQCIEPERELYRLLQQQGGDAYARYNALLRELASFEAALDARLSRGGIAR